MVKKGLAVLVADDIEPMRKVTAAQLNSLGVQDVRTAADGIEALKMLRERLPDIVLSDWNMPAMNGIELLRAMRADKRLEHLPFIMITAESERVRIEEAIAHGVCDLLVKPYTTGRLSLSMERAMSRRTPRFQRGVIITSSQPPQPATNQPVLPAGAGEAGKMAAVQSAAKLTILVVDDKPDNLHLLVNVFKDDYRILATDSGKKALDLCCSDTPPDLVLLDVMMPGMDGFEVARRMREHPNAENIPVIFVTAMTDDDARFKGMSLGAVDFVTKPVDPVAIRLRVSNFMRYVRLRRELQADYDSMLEAARMREMVEDITRHDMHGPLSTVLDILHSLMADKVMLRRNAMQLENAEQATLRLLDMINLSSELYKIESGRYVLDAKPVPITDIVRRVVELARTAFAERQLAIVVDSDVDVGREPPMASGDAMLSFSLVQSLVKNACEAAPARSRVTVTLADSDPLRITIVNKGAAPTPIRQRMFNKYTTLGKPSAAGLGAYSARLMAEAQGGQVSLDVADDTDTTIVTIALPRDASATP